MASPSKFNQARELSGQKQFCIGAFNYIWRHGLPINIWPLIMFLRGGSIEKQLYHEDVCRSLNQSNSVFFPLQLFQEPLLEWADLLLPGGQSCCPGLHLEAPKGCNCKVVAVRCNSRSRLRSACTLHPTAFLSAGVSRSCSTASSTCLLCNTCYLGKRGKNPSLRRSPRA